MSELERSKGELTAQLKELQKTLDTVRQDLKNSSLQCRNSKTQIDMLSKEKGVAMRDNASSYEHSIQMETQVRG